MRKCCCCISVHHGSVLLGLVEVLLAALVLLLCVPYVLEQDNNLIEKYSETIFYQTEEFLREQNYTKEDVEMAMTTARQYFYPTIMIIGLIACVWILISLMMIFGVLCEKRALLLPYLIIQLTKIVAFVMIGLAFTVMLFCQSILMGTMMLASYAVLTFILIYLWNVVRSTYKNLGYDFTYSTTPVKPIYNPQDGYYGQDDPLMMH